MAIWLFRAGTTGEYETKFLEDNQVYCTWDISNDMTNIQNKDQLFELLNQTYSRHKINTIKNWANQIWPFLHEMTNGDWVITPSKFKPVVHIARIVGQYEYHSNNTIPYMHSRKVEWFADVPKVRFDQDILYSMGAFLTICRIKRNDAEKRIKAIVENKKSTTVEEEETDFSLERNVESDAYDAISTYIIQHFMGHGMADIIAAILKAKGYKTLISPPGSDKGVDILAGAGPMGFDQPRLLVQVKSGDAMVDRPTLDQLVGAMTNFKADYGLLVSWSGFKSSVVAEMRNQFYKVKFWDSSDIIRELFENYNMLDEEIRIKLPLKQIWILDTEALE